MTVAADFRAEVDRVAGPCGRLRDQVEIRSQILHRTARRRHAIDIDRGAMILVRFEDQIQSLAAQERQILSIGRPSGRSVFESVVGQAADLSFQIDDPEIGAFVGVFVALMRIGNQGQRSAVGTPRGCGDIHVEVRQLFRRRRLRAPRRTTRGGVACGSRGSGR